MSGGKERPNWAAAVVALAAAITAVVAVAENWPLLGPPSEESVPEDAEFVDSGMSVEILSVTDPASVTTSLGYAGTPVAIEIRVTAGDGGDGSGFAVPAQLVDQDGRAVTSEFDPTYPNTFSQPAVLLEPGETRVGVLLFDLTDTSRTLTLELGVEEVRVSR